MKTAHDLIPQPTHHQQHGHDLDVTALTAITAHPRDHDTAHLLATRLHQGTGHHIPVTTTPTDQPAITLTSTTDHDPTAIPQPGDEDHTLTIDHTGIHINATTPAGVSRAATTLLQLLPPHALRRAPIEHSTLPHTTITDRPRLPWRGLTIDTARHYIPKPDLFTLIDQAWLHKINVIQLHLTDDQGWRIDIPTRPELRRTAAWRTETTTGHALQENPGDRTPHGGHYSLADLREINAYARRRHILLVPEINLPGHTRAALAAYPEIGTGRHRPVATTFGVFSEVMEPTETALAFTRDVLDTVVGVFDSPVIHIGGDEIPLDQWSRSPRARRLLDELGTDDLRRVQGWFVHAVADHLAGHGRRIAGWDEVLAAGAPSDTIVTVWRNAGYAERAVERGHQVIIGPETHAYLDHYESDDAREPLRIHGHTDIAGLEAWDPVPAGLDDRDVLGAQCQIFTEYLPTLRDIEYSLHPRLAAFADAAWSSRAARADAPVSDRIDRTHLDRLAALGVNYRPPAGPHPWQSGGTGPRERWDHGNFHHKELDADAH
ncbi:beta-N-acetylhexosaminidase [Salininema proteolyticum]|uniref:beta-N-acetylhexosaminidase n=1 Tax=Salininema proteolyticum TaxID=1607685 RepID=A0ABV8U300_9ACTN